MSDDMTNSQIEAIMGFFRKEFPDESVEVEAGHRQPTLLNSSSQLFHVAKEGVSHTIELTWEFLRDVKVEQYADELKQLGLADAMRARSNDKILFSPDNSRLTLTNFSSYSNKSRQM
ncbi:MAG: hypothetical protein ACLQVJ_01610 [Syntrophobacteraceae bacterium]